MRVLLLIIGLALLAAGPATMLAPSAAASAYGIGSDSSSGGQPYLVATAIRDVALGALLLAMLGLGATVRLLAAFMFAVALVAAGDAVNVVKHAGAASAPAVGVHAGACVLLLVLGLRLLKSERAEPRDGRPD